MQLVEISSYWLISIIIVVLVTVNITAWLNMCSKLFNDDGHYNMGNDINFFKTCGTKILCSREPVLEHNIFGGHLLWKFCKFGSLVHFNWYHFNWKGMRVKWKKYKMFIILINKFYFDKIAFNDYHMYLKGVILKNMVLMTLLHMWRKNRWDQRIDLNSKWRL